MKKEDRRKLWFLEKVLWLLCVSGVRLHFLAWACIQAGSDLTLEELRREKQNVVSKKMPPFQNGRRKEKKKNKEKKPASNQSLSHPMGRNITHIKYLFYGCQVLQNSSVPLCFQLACSESHLKGIHTEQREWQWLSKWYFSFVHLCCGFWPFSIIVCIVAFTLNSTVNFSYGWFFTQGLITCFYKLH